MIFIKEMKSSNCTYVHGPVLYNIAVRDQMKWWKKRKKSRKKREPKINRRLTTMWYSKYCRRITKKKQPISFFLSHTHARIHSIQWARSSQLAAPDVIHFHHLIKHHPSSTSVVPVFHIRFYFPSERWLLVFCFFLSHSVLWMNVAGEQLKCDDDLYLYSRAGVFWCSFLFCCHFHLSFGRARLSCVNGFQFFFPYAPLQVCLFCGLCCRWLALHLSKTASSALLLWLRLL